MTIFEKTKNLIYSLLKKSERYTQTDMVYLAKGGFWLTLGQIISTAAFFLLAIAFANLLDPTTYGNYKYILSLVGMLSIFTLTGMGTALTQAVARGFEGSFYSAFKEKLKFGVLTSIIAMSLAGYYFFRGNYILPIPLLLAAIFAPLMQASGIYGNFLLGKKLFNIQVKYSTLTKIITTLSLIFTLFLTKNLFCLIAIYFVCNAFLNYSFYLITRKKNQPNKKEDPETLPFGKHLSLMSAIGNLADQLDKILLFHFLGAVQVAIYSFALALPQQVKAIFLQSLKPLALTKISQKSASELKQFLPGKVLKLFLIILPIVGLYILIAPYIYRLLFPRYISSIIYSQVFAISLLLYPKMLLGQALTAHAKKKELYMASFSYSFSKIILLAIFLPLYGIWGAISVYLAIEVIYFIVLALFFKRM